MRLVNRLRVFGVAALVLSHLALTWLLPIDHADSLVVSLGVNLAVALAIAPLFANWLFVAPLRRIDAFVDRVKTGDFTDHLPVAADPAEDDETCEFNRLRRSLNWMARQIAMREERIRQQRDEAMALQKELRDLVIRDPLTRIFNRQYFQDRLTAAFADLIERGRPFTLAILDVDFFKRINDTHGHLAGDRVLVTLAGLLGTQVRDGDVVARIGGEEFGVLLTDIEAGHAEQVLSRLQSAIRATPFRLSHEVTVQVTVSMGFVSAATVGGQSHDEVIRRADEALYHVKRNGRDGLISWEAMPRRASDGRTPPRRAGGTGT